MGKILFAGIAVLFANVLANAQQTNRTTPAKEAPLNRVDCKELPLTITRLDAADKRLQDWATHLRHIGNEGAHDVEFEADATEAAVSERRTNQ